MGLRIGDPVEVRLFGELVPATIESFRRVDWSSGVNFAVIFSPGVIEEFPVNYIGMLKAAEGHERDIQTMLVKDFPELNFIAVGDAIKVLTGILSTLSDAVSIVGGIAVVSGLFVLAGAMAAGRAQREADAVVMKVLGATRADVVWAFLIEYGVLGALAAVLAAILGSIGAWAFVTQVMEMSFAIDYGLIVFVVAGAVALTIAVGVAMTWTALSVKPASYLRGE
jgi:putative ABC transport system permease protein